MENPNERFTDPLGDSGFCDVADYGLAGRWLLTALPALHGKDIPCEFFFRRDSAQMGHTKPKESTAKVPGPLLELQPENAGGDGSGGDDSATQAWRCQAQCSASAQEAAVWNAAHADGGAGPPDPPTGCSSATKQQQFHQVSSADMAAGGRSSSAPPRAAGSAPPRRRRRRAAAAAACCAARLDQNHYMYY